jgi:DNA-binding GntR family transcriptional regulator
MVPSVTSSDRKPVQLIVGTRLAYDAIRQAIVEGRYSPGQRLIEQRIAEELSLSRTPIRESLRLLEAEGLVESEPQRGVIVRRLSLQDVSDSYDLRARLESFVAERAAERATPQDVAALDAAVAAFEIAIAVDGPHMDRVRGITEANNQFHQTLVRMADHVQLGRLLARTVDIPLVFRAFQRFSSAETQRSNLFHQLIRDAVAAREPARAHRLMTEHILLGRDTLLEALREHVGGD